jgi:hypothetical protein
MSEPRLVPPGALSGVTLGLSVSESADLARLGLSPRHCELAVAELARAIIIAGGNIIYGGRLGAGTFTDILLDEVARYGDARRALTICLADSEHRDLTDQQLRNHRSRLSMSAEIVCLDPDGNSINRPGADLTHPAPDAATALSAARRHITRSCDARVVVGGRLTGYQGAMPGVVEEALLSLEAKQPLYVAGGFGGAAAAIARTLRHEAYTWAPPDFPAGAQAESEALDLVAAAGAEGVADDALSAEERAQLATTHRPGDVASLVVLGLSR